MMTFLQAAEAVATSEETRMGLWKLFSMGGWLMWPLLALGGVTIFIFVERFMAIRKASVLDMNFMNRIRDYISDGKIHTAVNLCKKTDTPIARMIEKGIERIGRPMSDVQTAIENVANLEVSKLENGLPFLATIAGGAPMIGFLGTVLGACWPAACTWRWSPRSAVLSSASRPISATTTSWHASRSWSSRWRPTRSPSWTS